MFVFKAVLRDPSTGEVFEDEWNPDDDYSDLDWSSMLDCEQYEAAHWQFEGYHPGCVIERVYTCIV